MNDADQRERSWKRACASIGARALSQPASVPSDAAQRPMQQGPGAGLGAQSLLLPGDDPAEGRSADRALRRRRPRREWRKRLEDHDGDEDRRRRHRALAQADRRPGPRPRVRHVDALLLPATRFAVQAYVHYVRERSLLEAVASWLTELFSPQIITERMGGMLGALRFRHAGDAWRISTSARRRPQRDADFALDWVKQHATDAGAAAGGHRRAGIQVRRAVVHAGCAALRLCRAGA